MSRDILSPLAVASRSAAANVPFAIAIMAVLAFGAWLANRGSAAQAHDSRRASFLRVLASQPQAISADIYAAYAADPDWRARALRELVDATLPDEVRAAIRQALAAA
jgi:Zn-dependent protease with chaperone function